MTKDITFFDLETTGLNVNEDRIVSFYAVNYKRKMEINTLLNPEIKIPEQATNVHGIKNEDVKMKPKLNDLKESINVLFLDNNPYICGYNICKYDIPLLKNSFVKSGFDFPIEQIKFIDIFYIIKNINNVRKALSKLTLENVYKHFTKKDLTAHDSKNDTIACVEILKVLNRKKFPWYNYLLTHLDLPGSVINDPNYILKFGKSIGKTVIQLIHEDPSYIKWLNKKGLIKLSSELNNLIYKNNE